MNKSNYKGIVLAGGTGTRLHPITLGISKHLLPIYDKPMIYYPISVLMLAGIKEILIICTIEDIENYKRLLGNGSNFGVTFQYKVQSSPDGLPQAFTLAKDFIQKSNVALVLGDNIFYGQNFSGMLRKATNRTNGASVFGYHVPDPERFGVIETSEDGRIMSIEEKPSVPKSSNALTGLYFFDNEVIEYTEGLTPSVRGELEIIDLINIYLKNGSLNLQQFGRGFAWIDTGTYESLLAAGEFIHTIITRQGWQVACLEEIAYNNNWIGKKELLQQAQRYNDTSYGKYLSQLI